MKKNNFMKIILISTMIGLAGCTTTPEQSITSSKGLNGKQIEELKNNIKVAKNYQRKGYHKVTVDYLNAVIKKFPNNSRLRIIIAKSYLAQKKYDQAKNSLLVALQDKSVQNEVYSEMGQMYLLQGRPLEAEVVLNQSLEVKESYKGYYRLGIALDMQKKHSQAQHYYKSAIAMTDNAKEAINNLALSYSFQGKLDDAIKLLEDSIIKFPDPKMYNNLSLLYWKKGDLKKAKSYMIFLSPEQAEKNLEQMRKSLPTKSK